MRFHPDTLKLSVVPFFNDVRYALDFVTRKPSPGHDLHIVIKKNGYFGYNDNKILFQTYKLH